MHISENALKNSVSAKKQLAANQYFYKVDNGADINVLFVGNSITLHGVKPEIGWYRNWGMAASAEENDYVHKTVAGLKERFGNINYAVTQLSQWEVKYDETADIMDALYKDARDFKADIVIVRIGENMSSEKLEKINCKPYFIDMINYLRKDDEVRVIVTDSFWKRDILDKTIHEVCAENGFTLCEIGDLEDDKSNMAIGLFEHEGVAVHPGDKGMALIAERLLKCI